MRAVHTFTVSTVLPESLTPLREIAMNLGWLSDERVQDLFRRIDPVRWDYDGIDAVGYLARIPQARLDELGADESFVSSVLDVREDLERSLAAKRWYQIHHPDEHGLVAYFSPEFGIAEALPQYSGGLGILAGDHLKAASDLGIPLVAIGLFYHHGYFRQALDASGWQEERFPRLNPREMALEQVDDLRIPIELGAVTAYASVWKATVGRIDLYLLDTDVPENDEAERLITDRLYGGGNEQRLRQELVLGVGGTRALRALGLAPNVFHMNEGHAGFLALERIRQFVTEDGLTFEEAVEAARPAQIFTTHTPVPAGIDRFPRELIEKYFTAWAKECRVNIDTLMAAGRALGAEDVPEDEQELNLAVMSLHLSGAANGVSALHGEVSRKMFAEVWPKLDLEDVPISSVTNGVHARSWVSREMSDLLDRTIGSDWVTADEERWKALAEVPDEELWSLRRPNRERLVQFARRRVREAALARGESEGAVAWCDGVLDPTVLTIGFARRFASYKRATLMFREPERLRALLTSKTQPVQFVFAGKAHPADDIGKDVLRAVSWMANDLDVRHRFVFLEDYGIGMARVLYRGVDVWLNNPVRPQEACGTSGMKAALNGGLNCSILDGWWDEMYEPTVGWAIPSAEWIEDQRDRDQVEASSLLTILENDVIPKFHDRGTDGLPHHWIEMMRASLVRLGPKVVATRMLRDYTEQFYLPAARRSNSLNENGHARAKGLRAWKTRIEQSWSSVHVTSMTHEDRPTQLGGTQNVWATIELGALSPEDVEVQLWHGSVDLDDDLRQPHLIVMEPGEHEGGVWKYHAEIQCDRSGSYGFTARIVPSHSDLSAWQQLHVAEWAPMVVDCKVN